jgi:hypothetical protein
MYHAWSRINNVSYHKRETGLLAYRTRLLTGIAIITACAFFPLHLHATLDTQKTFVQQQMLQYAQIETVSCDVRRDVVTPDGTIRWLSRVYFQKPDRLYAANAAPLPRLVISDGTTMFQHAAGHPRGFRRPLAELEEPMRINLNRIPGTLMEHLQRLEAIPETILEPTAEAPVRRAYETGHVYAILEADAQQRLMRILFYDIADRNRQTGEITCEAYEEVISGVWIAMQHQISVSLGSGTIQERIRFTNYEANHTIPETKFQVKGNFPESVEWVDSFDKIQGP